MMANILSWVLGIVLKAGIVTILYYVIKGIIRNGGSGIRLAFETIGMLVKYGCLNLRMKLTEKLHEKCEKEETIETEETDGPVKVEATIV